MMSKFKSAKKEKIELDFFSVLCFFGKVGIREIRFGKMYGNLSDNIVVIHTFEILLAKSFIVIRMRSHYKNANVPT